MNEHLPAADTLFGLWHPGSEQVYSGIGFRPDPERPDLLVGLLLVDRPHPASQAWLARVAQTFGDCTLIPLTAAHERGLACQMVVEAQSLPLLRELEGPQTQELRHALKALLAARPRPCLRMRWDEASRLWLSQFVTDDPPAPPPIPRPLFPAGDLLITPGALAAILVADQSPLEFLVRHVTGDWGDLDAADRRANARALTDGDRIFSIYRTADGVRLWVITEWDRSATTLLLPSEY